MNDDNITYVNYARKVAKRINNTIGEVFVLPYLETGIFPRLKGTDGERMSKSRNNEISLSDSPDTVKTKLDKLFSSHKAMKYIRIDTNGYYRHPSHPISNEFIPFQYLETFSNSNSTETKEAFNQGKINISELKNILLIDITKFIASVEKIKKSQMFTESRINRKLEESLFFAMDIIKSNEEKIQNIIQ
jgi:tryptophanyl-tRNA synthetase